VSFDADAMLSSLTVLEADTAFHLSPHTLDVSDVEIGDGTAATPVISRLTLASGIVDADRTEVGPDAGTGGELVIESGATWISRDTAVIGDRGSGAVTVRGTLDARRVDLGLDNNNVGTGQLRVTGSDATLNSELINAGIFSPGGVVVEQNATATVSGVTLIGQFGFGLVRVDEYATFNSGDDGVILGSQAGGRLEVLNGSTFNAKEIIASSGSGDGDMLVGGASNTILNITDRLVADLNETTLSVGQGGRVVVGSANLDDPLTIDPNTVVWGSRGGHAEAVVDGAGNASLTVIGELVLGDGGTSTSPPDLTQPDSTQSELTLRNGTVSSAQRTVLGRNGARAFLVLRDAGTQLTTREVLIGQMTSDPLDFTGGTGTAQGRPDGSAQIFIRNGSTLKVGRPDRPLEGDLVVSEQGTATIRIDPGGTLEMTGDLQVGPAATADLTVNGLLEADQVALSAASTLGGSGTVTADVISAGTTQPGNSPGVLEIVGDFTQTADGELVLELGSETWDQLLVHGTASLGGTLRLTSADGFVPEVGQVLSILDAQVLSGEFETITLGPGLSELGFQTVSDGGTLRLQTVPEPGAGMLLTLGATVLLSQRRRCRR